MSRQPESACGPSDDRLARAMSASNSGLAVLDLQGCWREVNPALARMLGVSAAEMIGRSAAAFAHADDSERLRQALAELAAGESDAIDMHHRYRHRGGADVLAQANVSLIRDPQGRPQYLFAHVRDVTAQRDANAQVQPHAGQHDIELQATQRQLQLFVDAVSHDLRAPLRSIESFSSLLAERAHDRLDATDHGHLSRIRAAAGRMNGLLGKLSELSLVTRADLRADNVDLSLLAEWVGAELQEADPERTCQLQVQPGLVAWGDERLLKMLLAQLLDNAWRFSRPRAAGLVEVSGLQVDGRLRMSIRDNGIGFDPDYAHKLFEPFQRLHGAGQGAGHGLGLAIAQRIAQRHDGRIHAQSQPESGATFTVELPIRAPVDAATATPAPAENRPDA